MGSEMCIRDSVTHDGTVSDDAVVEAAKKSGLPLAPAGPARPVRV